MTASATEYKRLRPGLGTLVKISIFSQENAELIQERITESFRFLESMESRFSRFQPQSQVSQINRSSPGDETSVDADLYQLLGLAFKLSQASSAAFFPYAARDPSPHFELTERNGAFFVRKESAAEIDLDGIAKGFIVDKIVEFLERRIPTSSGVVNAGGDLRRFGRQAPECHLRLYSTEKILLQKCRPHRQSMAASSLLGRALNPGSSTRYENGFFPTHGTIVAMADLCSVADAFTKIALFGCEESLAHCCKAYGVDIFCVDPHGQIISCRGAA